VTAIWPKHKIIVSSTSSIDGASRTDSIDSGGSTTNWETIGFKRTCKHQKYIKIQRYHWEKLHGLKADGINIITTTTT
jgi:hypothetical protein